MFVHTDVAHLKFLNTGHNYDEMFEIHLKGNQVIRLSYICFYVFSKFQDIMHHHRETI